MSESKRHIGHMPSKIQKTSNPPPIPMSVTGQMICAGLAGCSADLCTFPLDTVKVWLQVRSVSSGPTPSKRPTSILVRSLRTSASSLQSGALVKDTPVNKPTQPTISSVRTNTKFASGFLPLARLQVNPASTKKKGIVWTIANGVRKNGVTSLYGGISAGLQRQIAFSSVRFGIYDSVKSFYMDLFGASKEGKQIPIRILAGTTTALVAVGLFQPTEVVKIRMQAQARTSKVDRQFTSTLHAYKHLASGGIREAWRGLGANATRLAVVNVSELVTYDVVKETILDYNILGDTPACHFTSAFISGFVTTLVASPVDVIKTRYMNSQAGKYTGILDCTRKLFLSEGPKAFYKGFVPAYLRLGSWNIVMFVTYEQYKRMWSTHVTKDDV